MLACVIMSSMIALKEKKTAYYAASTSEFTARGHTVERNADGSGIVRGVDIFRAGTFRDSMGEQNTWTVEHLAQMVSNFSLLTESEIFVDVPVRRDHSFSVDKIMGYFESVRVEGDRLVADLRITEPDSLDKLVRGTFRSVSLEVGMYVTNEEIPYWPVVFGVAYVDISAVEGLHSSSQIPTSYFTSDRSNPIQEENSVSTENSDKGVPRPVNFTIKGVETSDHAAIQAHITELEKRPEAVGKFRVNGAETTDFAAVQAHIDTLETVIEEATLNARRSFVKELVSEGKIVAPQEETLSDLVTGNDFTEAQFEKFKASYADAPKQTLFENHGSGDDSEKDPANKDDSPSELTIAEETVAMLRRSSAMTEDELQQTKAFKRLTELKSNS